MGDIVPVNQLGPEGQHHVDFITWCRKQGVTYDSIQPARFPGKGIGMEATKSIKKGHTLIKVPRSAILTVNPDSPKPSSNTLSVHGRVASLFLEPQQAERIKPWLKALPPREEVETSMPHYWPPNAQDALPMSIQKQFRKSLNKLENDVRIYLSICSDSRAEAERRFRYQWLIVNSRCFYWDYPALYRRALNPKIPPKKRHRNDCLACVPFVDYFNHISVMPGDEAATERLCTVSYDAHGYRVVAEGSFEPGDEIFVSYGAHSNEYLLVEYGFVLPDNPADSLHLDEWILPMLATGPGKDLLEQHGMLGDYFCTTTEACHRTQCALRVCCLPLKRAERFVSGRDDGDKEQQVVNKLLIEVLGKAKSTIAERRDAIQSFDLSEWSKSQLDTLWAEKLAIVVKMLARLQ